MNNEELLYRMFVAGARIGYTARKTSAGIDYVRPGGDRAFTVKASDEENLRKLWGVVDRAWPPGGTA